MLKLSTSLLLATASLLAADPPPLSLEDKVETLQRIVSLQQAQQVAGQAEDQLQAAQRTLQAMAAEWRSYVASIRPDGADEACDLNVKAEWLCPVVEAPADEEEPDATQ